MQVVVLPGFVGSEMSDDIGLRNFVSSKVWVNKARILGGALVYLDLAADGESAGPIAKGVTCRNGGPEPGCYGPLITALQDAGHTVLALGWDWRKDMFAQGERVGAAVLGLVKTGDYAIVAHSAGGLVARVAAAYIRVHGEYSRLKRIVYLGTPQWGTYYVVSAICRQADLYQSLLAATSGRSPEDKQAANVVLDTILAHMVGLYQLLPAYGHGPFWDADPDNVTRVYDAAFWSAVNALITQERLDSARAFWGKVKNFTFREKESFIAGTDQKTPANYYFDKATGKLLEAVYHDAGDNTVQKISSLPADAGLFATSSAWAHELLPQIGDVQKKVMQFIGA